MFCELLDSLLQFYVNDKLNETQIDDTLQSLSYIFESMAVIIFLLSREPHDCFNCFNRVTQLKYSAFAGNLEDSQRFTKLQLAKSEINQTLQDSQQS